MYPLFIVYHCLLKVNTSWKISPRDSTSPCPYPDLDDYWPSGRTWQKGEWHVPSEPESTIKYHKSNSIFDSLPVYSIWKISIILTVHMGQSCGPIFFRHDHMTREVTITLVGKYTRLEDSYTSVIKALRHAAMACDHRLKVKVMGRSRHKHLIVIDKNWMNVDYLTYLAIVLLVSSQ